MILVSGGSGVMGAQVVRGLLEAGHAVRALVLPDDPLNTRLDNLTCDVWEGDITRPETLKGAF
ncbi:NmrA family NAD(P)-binding protein, partial [Myxococcota bacterium]